MSCGVEWWDEGRWLGDGGARAELGREADGGIGMFWPNPKLDLGFG